MKHLRFQHGVHRQCQPLLFETDSKSRFAITADMGSYGSDQLLMVVLYWRNGRTHWARARAWRLLVHDRRLHVERVGQGLWIVFSTDGLASSESNPRLPLKWENLKISFVALKNYWKAFDGAESRNLSETHDSDSTTPPSRSRANEHDREGAFKQSHLRRSKSLLKYENLR